LQVRQDFTVIEVSILNYKNSVVYVIIVMLFSIIIIGNIPLQVHDQLDSSIQMISSKEIVENVIDENTANILLAPVPPSEPTLTDANVSPKNPHHQLGEEITFSVTYTDADNDTPDHLHLTLYDSEDADFFVWQMSKADPLDNDYTDGVIYTVVVNEGAIDELDGVGIHEYNFATNDDSSTSSVFLPASGNFTDLEIINIEPTLTDHSVTSPVEDGSGTQITFSVNYTQSDNVEPDHLHLTLYDSEDGDFFVWQMSKADPLDNDYTDGVIYTVVVNEGEIDELDGVGIHEYNFATSDEGSVSTVFLPESGNYTDFEIIAAVPEFDSSSAVFIAMTVPLAVIILLSRRKYS